MPLKTRLRRPGWFLTEHHTFLKEETRAPSRLRTSVKGGKVGTRLRQMGFGVAFRAASGEQRERKRDGRVPSKQIRVRRLVGPISLALVIVLTVTAPAGFAGTHRAAKPPRTDLRPLWSAFPLQQQPHRPRPAEPQRAQSPTASKPAKSADSGWTVLRLLLVVGTALLLLAGLAVAGVSLLRRRRGPLRAHAANFTRPRFRLAEGGSNVTFLRRRPSRDDGASPSREQPQEQPEGRESRSPRERLLQYSMTDEIALEEPAEAPSEPAVDKEAEPMEAEAHADVTNVGEEVGAVLKSAQEAAARIRGNAQEEAERVRAEAESVAAAVVAEARQAAEADRAESTRIRAEAEAYARDTRAAADAFAEQRQGDAEREAAQIASDAERRLADADAKVEQTIRQATAMERERIEALQAEVAHYEERLDSILVVFRGVTSQLEDLLRKRQRADQLDVSDEALETALRPDRATARGA